MHCTITLKTLSPVHIGGKTQELTPLEGVVFQNNCFVIDETRLGRVLAESDRLDAFSNAISQQGTRFNLEHFLNSNRLLNEQVLEQCAAYRCGTLIGRTPRRFRPFVREAFNRPFVPGSSIKGVFRTAVLYNILKRMKRDKPSEFNRYFTSAVKQKLDEFNNVPEHVRYRPWFKDRVKQGLAKSIENQFIQRFNLPATESYASRGPTYQQRDFMRVLKVSDTQPLEKNSLALEEVQVISITGDNELYLKNAIYVEVIPEGTELQFTISLDENILNDFASMNKGDNIPFRSFDDLFSMASEFALDMWEHEKQYWGGVNGPGALEMRDFYTQEPANFRIGWGSGLTGVSLLLLLPENLRLEIRDTLYEPRGQAIFPKSRRSVMEKGAPKRPLGWVLLN